MCLKRKETTCIRKQRKATRTLPALKKAGSACWSTYNTTKENRLWLDTRPKDILALV